MAARHPGIIPGWAANPQLVAALGPAVTEGIISVDSVSNEGSPAYAAYDAAYKAAMNQPGASNVYAAMTWDMAVTLALAIEKAKSAQSRFKKGTPEWTRANDVLTFAGRN